MRHERLIANAGSGKTHALTTRMIQLLARGVDPSKIAALTFTRKSAGEFLAAVFERLAMAALDSEKLADLHAKEHLDDLDAEQCRRLLAILSRKLGRLGMGTIDSLFARIARAFPLESGLAEDFSMAGEAAIVAARERTLAELFAKESRKSLADFIDLLRRINRNQGERDVFNRLLRETETLHAKFLATPPSATWGNPVAIWGSTGCDILNAGAIAPAAQQLWMAIQAEHPDLQSAAFQTWQAGIALATAHSPGEQLSEDLKKFLGKLSNERQTSDGLTYIPTGNAHAARVFLSPRIRSLRDDLRNSLLKLEFESVLARSRSLHAFMREFEETYSTLVRASGLLTFGDITDSLARKALDDHGAGESWRATAAYRIDQQFDHWLLDEFQDTSRPQWKILNAFISEALMDPSGQRTFFYVGDTKQAIYSWRGGDPDLFFEIFDEFNSITPTIHDAKALDESWRSCKAILDFVNQTFGDLTPVKIPLEIPESAAAKWAKGWREHSTSSKTRSVEGYAAWVQVPKSDGDEEEEAAASDLKILAILEETRAWERGLECAVLKPDNDSVAAIAALLQSKGIPVAVEGKSNPCVDNPLGAALLATMRMVASPDDKLSRALAMGFPAASSWGVMEGWKFRKKTLESLARHGYAATLREWIQSSDLEAEPFLKERAAAFLLAAEEFDTNRKPGDGVLDFLRFVEKRQTSETEASGVVRIMTVHQSKGLGFDMVIADGLDKKGRTNDGTQVTLGPEAKAVKWGVVLPPKEFALQDETLRKLVELEDSESKYGKICNAYVALTRAKKALYVLTTELGDNSKSKNFARFLSQQFANAPAEFGNANWFEAHALIDKRPEATVTSPAFENPIHGTPKPASPSSFKPDERTNSHSAGFSLAAAELGTQVHEALARIEWLDAQAPRFDGLSDEALELLKPFLARPETRRIFTRPPAPVTLWREQPFDVMIEGKWVSGIFDRVEIHRSPDGSPTQATIYDFKTDHGTDSEIADRYSGQMAIYRQAAAQLLGSAPESVESRIVRVR